MNIEDYYQGKISYSLTEIKRYERLVDVYSFARLFAILFGLFLVYYSIKFETIWLTELIFLGVVFIFLWLVSKQSAFSKKKDFYLALRAVNENELDNIRFKKNIYNGGSSWINDQHAYSSDLDIFGQNSLFQLVNRSATLMGSQKLADWFISPATPDDIKERQAFVKELSSNPAWKLDFQAMLLFARQDNDSGPRRLINYLNQSANTLISRVFKLYIRWIPLVFFISAFLAYYIPILRAVALLIAVINILVVFVNMGRITKIREIIGNAGKVLASYSEGFDQIENASWASPLGKKLKNDLKNNKEVRISVQIKRLSTLINRFDTGTMSVLGLFLNLSMVWNLRQAIAIEDWKLENQGHIEQAFHVLSKIEAAISLSSLHSNYPEWCFPEVIENENYTLTVSNAAHPLIAKNLRVPNNFTLENTHKADIITGSNMAGKSTFLRTLGINAVLAFSGAPVCAESMTLTRMYIFTYMRIRDSINESTSTFKAELDRLQQLLKKVADGEKVYFLIDEMLRGTNSVDKYLGSKAIIEKLIAQQAVGIVATHDLQIAQLEQKYPDYVRNFYFDIRMEGTEMLFDYKLKDGECKTFNALQLLKKLGIEVDPQV